MDGLITSPSIWHGQSLDQQQMVERFWHNCIVYTEEYEYLSRQNVNLSTLYDPTVLRLMHVMSLW